MKLFLKFTGGFYIFWSFMEVFLIFQALTALNAAPDSPVARSLYLQIAGFFLKLVAGSMAFLVDRKREFALVGAVFAGLDAVLSVYMMVAWQRNNLMPVFYLIVDLTLAAFLLMVFRAWKKGGPAPFASRRAPGRPSANASAAADAAEPLRPFPPAAPYPPVREATAVDVREGEGVQEVSERNDP